MPSVEGGGVEKNFFLISNYLATKLNNISIITAEKNLNKKISNKINIIRPKSDYWRNNGRLRKYLICIFLLIRFIFIKKNVLVFSFQANIYAIVISRLLRVKIISRSNSSPTGWSQNFFKNLVYKIGLNLANKVIVNSLEFKKEIFKKFNVNSVCIYNPLNVKEILKLSKKKILNFPKNPKILNIINVGRLVDQKDHLTLLKAINKIKNKINFKLLIIGRGKNKKNLQKYIKENKLNKKVKILYTDNPFPYILKSDLFILSSRFEGLPNVLLESICLKKFIISSSCPTGPKEILDRNKGGILFEPNNSNDLAKKILFYEKNKKILKKKSIYAYKRLIRFDYNINLEKYYKVIKDI